MPISSWGRSGSDARAGRARRKRRTGPSSWLLAAAALLGVGCSDGGDDVPRTGSMLVSGSALSAVGMVGGPFSPPSATFTISNPGVGALDFEVVSAAGWLGLQPPDGRLESGESVQVLATILPAADALPAGEYTGTIEFRNLSNGQGDTARAATLFVTTSAGLPMTSATRTSGTAPLAVFFDAVGGASGVVQPDGPDPDYAAFHYRWSFGDPGSGVWQYSGKSKNSAVGYVAAHVFETPGLHRVSLRVTRPDGSVLDYHQDVTVTDPDDVYGGATYYVSGSGSDASDGTTPGSAFRTVAHAMSVLFASNGPRRVLFRRGDTWIVPDPVVVHDRTGPFTLGAYGTGANPRWTVTHPGGGIELRTSVRDVRIVDLDLVGPGAASASDGVQLGRDSLLLRCRVAAFARGVGGASTNAIANTVADCTLVDHRIYGLYYGPTYNPPTLFDPPIHLAVMGTRFDNALQNSLLRAYVSRSVWHANLFQRAGQSATRLLGMTSPKKSEFVMITDNLFRSTTVWTLEIGPENDENGSGGGEPQIVENVILEGNVFSLPQPANVIRQVFIWGLRVTVRNNVFDYTGASAGSCIRVDRRGIGPLPVGTRIENNTAYRGDAAPSFLFVEATSADLTLVRNNIVHGPATSSTAGVGSVQLANNLTANPLFEAPAGGNFRLQASSPAVDQGLAIPIRADFDGNPRPQGNGVDIGAFERP